MAHLDAVQARLAQNEAVLQQQIEELQLELRRDQDPNRMQQIQEMISVRDFTYTTHPVADVLALTQDLLGQISRIRPREAPLPKTVSPIRRRKEAGLDIRDREADIRGREKVVK